jgi:hypothetical protein
MGILLNLSDLDRSALQREAERQGTSPEALAASWIHHGLSDLRKKAWEQYRKDWIENGDEEEQRETYEALRDGLNANRRANGERLLFPE